MGDPAPLMLRGLDPDWWQVEEGVSMVVRPSLPSRSPGVTGMPQCRCVVSVVSSEQWAALSTMETECYLVSDFSENCHPHARSGECILMIFK